MSLIAFSDIVDPITDIRIWGKSGWRFLLAIAIVYPVNPTMEDKLSMRNFLVDVAKVLPCKKCGSHFRDAVKYSLTEDTLANRNNLMHWMHTVQNDIRSRQNKPNISYADMVRECMTGQKEDVLIRCSFKHATLVLLMTVIILILYIAHNKRQS